MLVSMTGFASTDAMLVLNGQEKINISMSLKSLNSRFFETTCKLPYLFSSLETDLIKLFKEKLIRGHIYFTVYMEESKLFKGDVEPSLALIKGYMQAIEKLKQHVPSMQGSLTIDNLFRIPNAFTQREWTLDEATKNQIFNLIHQLIISLQEARQKEGAVLAADLAERTRRLSAEIETIHQESNRLMEEQQHKVQIAMQEIIASGNGDQLAEIRKNALLAMLDKMDIHEEIVRFKSHLENFNDYLHKTTHEKGKQLDFILQELGREINTVCAKCSDASIGSRAITVKVELEKAREQIQNIV
jgi:uncharacterized protein (TIGR00255 family)